MGEPWRNGFPFWVFLQNQPRGWGGPQTCNLGWEGTLREASGKPQGFFREALRKPREVYESLREALQSFREALGKLETLKKPKGSPGEALGNLGEACFWKARVTQHFQKEQFESLMSSLGRGPQQSNAARISDQNRGVS